jgi:hypothetical protein
MPSVGATGPDAVGGHNPDRSKTPAEACIADQNRSSGFNRVVVIKDVPVLKVDLVGEIAQLLITALTAVSGRLQLGAPKLWTTSQLAHRYQVDARTIKAWTKQKKIPVVRISERCLRFDPDACDAALGGAARVRNSTNPNL